MLNLLAEITGVVGVLLILGAYWLLQSNILTAHSMRYLLMNTIGPSFILLSLCVDWNLAAFLIEAVWLLISLISIFKILVAKLTRK